MPVLRLILISAFLLVSSIAFGDDDAEPSDPIAGKLHWAFRPLSSATLPDVKDIAWPRSGIDYFVLSRLQQQGLQPVSDASRRTLVRRVYYLLTGLPPTPSQIEQYEKAPANQALEQLVDQLLASPQFGERWGRHWLDLARYADSNGLDENFLFREAWRYRNWVISAVDRDIPYDRFLLQQIAGDLLPYESIEQRDQQRIAAGFLVVGPKVLLGIEAERQRMDVADEQIDTIGRTVLGQTLGCARCHDHKFDPVPTADYYALAGIFTSTNVMERRHMLGQQRVMERLVGLGPKGDELDSEYEVYWREQAARKKRAQAAASLVELLQMNKSEAIAKLKESDPDAFAEALQDESLNLDERVIAQKKFADELKQSATPPDIPPRAMIPADVEKPADEAVRFAGVYNDLGEEVPRGFLSVLCEDSIPPLPQTQSGRIELAHWLTDVDAGAGRLAARVQVNRIWHHLMGRGLVRTVDNFGRTGESPTHPELLDYLAEKLIAENWSLKSVIREIVLSRTFQLRIESHAQNQLADPENRWLWRAHRRRLDPESLRDGILQAADQLDLKPMDSTVWYLGDQATAVGDNKVRRRTDFPCRSVYLPVIRNDLPEWFEVFDFADPHTTTGARPQTTVPTQGLFLLNDEQVMAAADGTADRLLQEVPPQSRSQLVDRMFAVIVQGVPTEPERKAIVAFLEQTEKQLAQAEHADPARQALTLACHALFASGRNQFLE